MVTDFPLLGSETTFLTDVTVSIAVINASAIMATPTKLREKKIAENHFFFKKSHHGDADETGGKKIAEFFFSKNLIMATPTKLGAKKIAENHFFFKKSHHGDADETGEKKSRNFFFKKSHHGDADETGGRKNRGKSLFFQKISGKFPRIVPYYYYTVS
jgi:hypothetical protein